MRNSHNILIVDDDPRICRLLQRYLEQEGYRIYTASNAREMRLRLAEVKVNLVLLDILLPDEDGFVLLKELRVLPNVAIIMVTGKDDPFDKIVGLELGADDYVTKPFNDRELLARVRSVLRRTSEENPVSEVAPAGTVACFAGWQLDLSAYELTSPDGTRVFLTTREFQLLAALIRRPRQVLSREDILELLAGRDWTPIDRSIDVLIGKLRKKLGDEASHPVLVKTVRGIGYKLGASVEFR